MASVVLYLHAKVYDASICAAEQTGMRRHAAARGWDVREVALDEKHLAPALRETLRRLRPLGCVVQSGSQAFTGTVKSYRYYDRPLTNEELVRNRQVDSARYFGELAFTNIVVAVDDNLDVTATPAPGAYAVEGAYAFTVAAGNDTPNGYKLQDWDGTKWTNARFVESLSYTYDAATSAPLVKLTWRNSHPFIFVVR